MAQRPHQFSFADAGVVHPTTSAASTTLALSAGLWFRRGRLLILPPARGQRGRCQIGNPLSRAVQILRATSRTIKDANVKRYHDDSHDQLRLHLADFVAAYNIDRRLKTLRRLTPYQAICKSVAERASRFHLRSHHHIPGPNN